MYLIDKMLDPAEMIAYLSVEWPTYEKLRHISNLPYSIRIFYLFQTPQEWKSIADDFHARKR